MQQAVLCYLNSIQISLLLCLLNRDVHCEIDVYSFKELSYSGLDTVGVRRSLSMRFRFGGLLRFSACFSPGFTRPSSYFCIC